MRAFFLSAVLLLALTPATTLNARMASHHPPETFNAFWAKFKAAVRKNDKEAIASMTRLPFMYESRDIDRAEYIKVLDTIITRKDSRCFARSKPLKDGETYAVFCGEVIFSFEKVNGEWKFIGIHPND